MNNVVKNVSASGTLGKHVKRSKAATNRDRNDTNSRQKYEFYYRKKVGVAPAKAQIVTYDATEGTQTFTVPLTWHLYRLKAAGGLRARIKASWKLRRAARSNLIGAGGHGGIINVIN